MPKKVAPKADRRQAVPAPANRAGSGPAVLADELAAWRDWFREAGAQWLDVDDVDGELARGTPGEIVEARARLKQKENAVGLASPDPKWSILREMAGLEARLLAGRPADPWWNGAARVLEGLRYCLMEGKAGPATRTRAQVLDSCATQLLHEARGAGAVSAHPVAGEPGRQAERLRAAVEAALKRTRDPGELAGAVQIASVMWPAPDVLPTAGRSAQAGWRRAIADVLVRLDGEDGDGRRMAEAIVCACAKSSGAKRPSRFFERAKLAERRRRGPANRP